MLEEDVLLDELQVDDVAVPILKESARWAKFLGVVVFVCAGLLLLLGLLAGATISSLYGRYYSVLQNSASIVLVICLFVAAIIVFWGWLLYGFATNVRRAVDFGDQVALEKGIDFLKKYFITAGIFGILGLLGNLLGLMGR